MKIAIIDAGTNTFSMRIFTLYKNRVVQLTPIERHYVNLAEGGLSNLKETAQDRAIKAFRDFQLIIKREAVEQVLAFGTAALRKATNGEELVQKLETLTTIQIQVIDGAKEAELIYKGVRLASPLKDTQHSLIIDIGGGSVEFIICNKKELCWAQSFPIGIARLQYELQLTDPISKNDKERLFLYLEDTLKSLIQQVEKYQPTELIGASGTFDALEAMIGEVDKQKKYNYIAQLKFSKLATKLQHLSYEERKAFPNLPTSRAKLIVIAILLVNWVLSKTNITSPLVVSTAALKEGALAEYLDGN